MIACQPVVQDGIIESSAGIVRSQEFSLAGVTLEMRALDPEVPSDQAIRHRFVRLTSLLLAIIPIPAALFAYALFGEEIISGTMLIGVTVFAGLLALTHRWARSSTTERPALALIGLMLLLPIVLGLLNPTPGSIFMAPSLLVIPVIAAASLLGSRWVIPTTLLAIAMAIGGHLLTDDLLTPPLREIALIRSIRVVTTLVLTAAIGWFFSRGLSQLIAASREANLRLAARARRQATLAYLGQRALASFESLAAATVERTPVTLDIDLCALAISGDEDGLWLITFADARRPKHLTIPVGSALDGALHDDQPTLVGLDRELGDERLQGTRCLVVSTTFTNGRRAALLACSRDHEAVGENEVPFLQTSLSLLSTAARRQEAETLRSRSKARYADLVKLSPDGIVTVDRDGLIASVNPAAASLFDLEPESLRGRRFTDLCLDEGARDDANGLFTSVIRDPRAKSRALWVERQDDERRRVEINAQVTTRDDGSREIVAILRDVTDRYHLEEQLRLSQRLESLGLLAGGVAHDFNNILTVVITSAAILRDEGRLGEQDRELVHEIYDAGERAARLTNQLLAFSRRQVLSPRHVDLVTAIREIEKMLRRLIGEDIELIVDLTDDLGTVYADPSQIEQVLINLCVNARAAMPSGGLLLITGHRNQISEPLAGQPQVANGDYAHLKVSDTGTGMDAATQARIFEPFFTTKEPGEGTGLGLSMVHGFVQQSGGYIWPESEIDRGSTFHVLLPRADRAADAGTTRNSTVRRGEGRILVIEDEPLVRTVATRILIGAGYEVIACDGPTSALETFAADTRGFDLVVSDVVMPGMSGIEVIKLLRLRQPGLRALLVSGYPRLPAGLEDSLRSMTLISKPFTPASLSAAVSAILDP